MGRFLILMTDGSSKGNPGPSSIGWVLWTRDSDRPFAAGGKSIGNATNNAAEWKALIEGLKQAKSFGATKVVAYTDSQLVVNQFNGTWKVKHPIMERLCNKVRQMANDIGTVEVVFAHRQILHLADVQARKAYH